MFRSISHFTLLVVSLSCLVPANARAEESQAVAAAQMVMKVIDSVLEHHIEPPTRQEMVLRILRHIAAEDKKLPSPELSQRISAADPESLETVLAQELAAYIKKGDSPTDFTLRTLGFTEFVAPGHLRIHTKEGFHVEQQLAGNRYVGIGISVTVHAATKQPQIVKVIPGGAAAEAGARDNDIFESIDGQPTQGESLADAIKRLRGKEGTDVTVVLRQPQEKESREYTLTRAVVPFTTVKQPNYSDNKRVAAIGFDRFSASTVNELRKIEAQLPETVEVVTLDFRRLHGRDLHHGILIGNALLDDRPIGQIESRDGMRKVAAEPGALFGDRKLIILYDQRTQGTPLWIAAAVDDAVWRGTPNAQLRPDDMVYEGVPLEGGDLVIEIPTKRLRRVGGGQLSSPQSMFRVLPPSERSHRRTRPRIPPQVLSTKLEELADEISRRLQQSASDESKE
jgi:C-terminal processing protease CtpA/Prc